MSANSATETAKFCCKKTTLNQQARSAFSRRQRTDVLVPEFVDLIPDQINPGRLYVSIKMAAAVHSCPCCCGLKVVTPISSTDWCLTFDLETISLHPSVSNFPCGANYLIRRNRVLWLDAKSVRLASIVAYVRSNVTQPGISAAAVARDMGLSVRYVHKLFEQEGITFNQYVADIRLDWIAEILTSEKTNKRLVDLIRQSGYRDSSAFYRAFKRRFGCTPRSFRRTAKEQSTN